MNYVLDTNFIIHLLKGDLGAVSFVRTYPKECLLLTSVTQAELYYGAYKSKRVEKNLAAFEITFKEFSCLDFDSESARRYGLLRTALEKQGEPCGPYDMQIASIALVNDCTVVTRNLREFSRMSGLKVIGY